MPNTTPTSSRAPVALALAVAIAIPPVMYFEGRENTAYLDIVGVPTICYGSTSNVKLGQTKTTAECSELLRGELGRVCKFVDAVVTQAMSAARLAALCSFVYNVGEGAFRRSTILKQLNAGLGDAACAELDRWVYAGGKRVPGLVKRRAVERAVCEWSVTDEQIRSASALVSQLINVPLSTTRRAALSAYATRVGPEMFTTSPVVEQLNAGRGSAACALMMTWPKPVNNVDRERRMMQQRLCEVVQ